MSIVRTLVAMLEPERGVVFDPCCGSGGMFVQADEFTKHSRRLSFYGQESKDFTYRLCRMNLFIHGLDGDIRLGNSYLNDQHASVRADYLLASPPFNDGSTSILHLRDDLTTLERGNALIEWQTQRETATQENSIGVNVKCTESVRGHSPLAKVHFHLKDDSRGNREQSALWIEMTPELQC